jgi:hypothetical protein
MKKTDLALAVLARRGFAVKTVADNLRCLSLSASLASSRRESPARAISEVGGCGVAGCDPHSD